MAAASKKDKPWVVTYDQEARPYVVMPAKDVGEEAPEMSADVSMRRLLMQGLELQYLRKVRHPPPRGWDRGGGLATNR